jgi:cytoskeletal protein CcmA (bactofilin family)
MAGETREFEAMVVPRGARIIAGDGGRIELDVKGDLILQENQQGLTSLVSQHGSILIDEGVTVRSSRIRAEHLIRIRGRLETDQIRAASISVESGALRCGEIQTSTLSSRQSEIEVREISAQQVLINGGSVEIGKIEARTLRLENKVRGAILISTAEDRRVDETVQVKGGFESDVELLGYLLKYRRQVMSDRVLRELKTRKEGREFQRFLLREKEIGGEREVRAGMQTFPGKRPEEEIGASAVEAVEEAEAVSSGIPAVEGEGEVPAAAGGGEQIAIEESREGAARARTERIGELEADLRGTIGDIDQAPNGLKLILACLQEYDYIALQENFSRWMGQLEPSKGMLSVGTLEALERIADFLALTEKR